MTNAPLRPVGLALAALALALGCGGASERLNVLTGSLPYYRKDADGRPRNDASGAAALRAHGGVLLVDDGDDAPEPVPPFLVDVRANFAVARLGGAVGERHEDVEAATFDGERAYVLSSQEGDDARRCAFSRFRVAGGHATDVETICLRDVVRAALQAAFGPAWFQGVAPLDPGEGGLSVEGLTRTPSRGRLLVGLRSPLHEERAILVSLDTERFADGALAANAGTVDLGGLGVRSIEHSPTAGGYFIAAGPADEGPGFALFFWPGSPSQPVRLRVPELARLCRPEAVAEIELEGRKYLMVVSEESGDECQEAPFNFVLVELDRAFLRLLRGPAADAGPRPRDRTSGLEPLAADAAGDSPIQRDVPGAPDLATGTAIEDAGAASPGAVDVIVAREPRADGRPTLDVPVDFTPSEDAAPPRGRPDGADAGSPWGQRAQSTPWPAPRRCGTLVFDEGRGTIVLFGGLVSGPPERMLRDLWEWDGSTGRWSNRTPDPLPTAWPSPRACPVATYDTRRGRIVVASGSSELKPPMDLWEYASGSGSWTRLTPDPVPPAWPLAPADVVYDRQSGRLIAGIRAEPPESGAEPGPENRLKTLEYDAASRSWTDVTSCSSPIAPDAVAGSFVDLHDGTLWFGDAYGQSWSWDRSIGAWKELGQDRGWGPPAVFERASGTLWALPSGSSMWRWDRLTAAWMQIAQPGVPQRREARAALDAARRKIVLFGGVDPTDRDSNDLWELDLASLAPPLPAPRADGGSPAPAAAPDAGVSDAGAASVGRAVWRSRTPASETEAWPPPRACAGVAVDAGRSRVLLFGGKDGERFLRDLWEWNGSEGRWTNRTPQPLPASWPEPSRCPHVAWDAAEGFFTLRGGEAADAAVDFAHWNATTGAWSVGPSARLPVEVEHTAYDPRARAMLALGRNANQTGWETWTYGLAARTWSRGPSDANFSLDMLTLKNLSLVYGGEGRSFVVAGYDNRTCPGSPGIVVFEPGTSARAWVRRVAARAPVGGPAACDPAAGRLVVLGEGGVVGRSVWEWSVATGAWTDRTPDTGARPLLRQGAAVVFDPTRSVYVVFGGEIASPPQALGDLWELSLPR